MRLIRVMCSGRVDLGFVLRAFSNGIDGVFIGACRLNECNYVTHGNYHTLNMVLLARRIMEHMGLSPERLKLEFMSGADANLFADAVNGFVQTVRTIGPLGEGEGMDLDELRSKITGTMKLVPYIKMLYQEKLESRLHAREEYDGYFTLDEIEGMFRDVASYYIDENKCQACSTCLKRCPVDAIEGAKRQIHVIDQDKCIKCGTCLEVCPPKFGAVRKIVGEPVPPPIPMEARTLAKKSKD